MPHSYGADLAAEGRLGLTSLGHHEADAGEAGAEDQHDEDRQVLPHGQAAPAPATAARWTSASLSRRWSMLAHTPNISPLVMVKAMAGRRSAPRSRSRITV